MILAVHFPYVVNPYLFHRVWHQMNGHGRVHFLDLMRAQETSNTIKELRQPLRLVGNDDFTPRPRDADHLINGLLFAREEIDPANVQNAVEGSRPKGQSLSRPQEKVY